MAKISFNAKRILYAVDADYRVVGAVTDGDIRRALLQGKELNDSCVDVVQTSFMSVAKTAEATMISRVLRESNVELVPVVGGSGSLFDFVSSDDKGSFRYMSRRDEVVILICGGKGTRLLPLTESTPKPLVEIGSEKLIDKVISQFTKFGFYKFKFSLGYLGHLIENYIRESYAETLSYEFYYDNDQFPSGTAGSLFNMGLDAGQCYFICNSDVITDVNMLWIREEFHDDSSFLIARSCVEVEIPFGVIDGSDGLVVGVHEKPKYDFPVSTGLYCMRSKLSNLSRPNTKFDMPELIQSLLDRGEKVQYCDLKGRWLDVGTHAALHKLRAEFDPHPGFSS